MNQKLAIYSEDDPIAQSAADWLYLREEGFTPQQAREFECWRRLDPRHEAAARKLERACALFRKIPLIAHEMPAPATHEPTNVVTARFGTRFQFGRRVMYLVGTAAAVIAILAGWLAFTSHDVASARYATSSGGYERVLLADGSTIELNANSEVSVHYSPQERRVALSQGEAHFMVARDAGRPFVVDAAGVSIRAIGTAFNVRYAAAAIEVLVTDGKVRVLSKSAVSPEESAAVPLLEAGERAVIALHGSTVEAPPQVEKMDSVEIQKTLDWQERKLVFSDTPLREVVRQFNRRNRIKLVINGADTGDMLIGGTFSADNTESFVRLFEESGDIVSERRGAHEIVLRKSP